MLALGWYYLVAERFAVFLYTGSTRDRLWEFCVEELPAGLPPLYEEPLPGSASELVPIQYVCTYTQTVPGVTVVHTDVAGTMVAAAPLAVLIAGVSIRCATLLWQKHVEQRRAASDLPVGSHGGTR